jgi:DNA-3-methyladenine glycosylase
MTLGERFAVARDTMSMRAILPAEFFARHALTVARQLLGKYIVICREEGCAEEAFQIHETEAYIGAHDRACHGRFGVTPRTAVLFGPPGNWYVHFTYGMHWMLNVVTDRDGSASGVLIRGAGPYHGPARLTKALGIDKRFNALPIAPESGLWIEDRGHAVRRSHVRRTPRIGIDYAGDWKHKPYRFLLHHC